MSDEWERERGNGREGEQKKNDDAGDLSAKDETRGFQREVFSQKIDIRAVTNTSSLCYEMVRDTSDKDDLIKTFSDMERHVSLHSQTVGLLCKIEGNINSSGRRMTEKAWHAV